MKLKKSFVENILDFEKVTKKPEIYISNEDSSLTKTIRTLVKNCYDFTKDEEDKTIRSNTLPELITENFDLEQIWQQIELQNEETLTRSLTSVSKHLVGKDQLLFVELSNIHEDDRSKEESELDNQHDEASSESELNEDVSDDDSSTDSKDEGGKSKQITTKSKPSIVDDRFFKLDEMETFLNVEDRKFNADNEKRNATDDYDDDDDEEEKTIDLFQYSDDIDDDDENTARLQNPKYDDFFGDPKKESKKYTVKFSEDLKVEMPTQKSTLELREERIKSRIENIEQSALAEKPWQLKGEVTAQNRPQNSLLEEIVEFDLTSRPAPVITEQTTFQLEDIIRQRIKDRAFDSVERKQKPTDTPLEYKKKLVLNQEKSKESLAQIYEKEYLQQREALNPDMPDKEEEEPELHKEIKTMLHGLFTKLDALSNFHFTPRAVAPELKIVSNLPAINIEEVAPVATSDAALLAPEEVKPNRKGETMSKTERTATDKKRERRKKKLKQREHAKEKKKTEEIVSKMRPGLGNKYSKEKAKKLLEKATKGENVEKMNEEFGHKGTKSSTAFFKQLQEDVKSHIKNKSIMHKKKKAHNLNAKKMKL